MLKPNSNALRIVDAILCKVTGVKKPVAKFVIHIVELWLGMSCRYVFSNMERWGEMTEKSYRNGFKKPFDWFNFNFALLKQHGGKEVTAVFDPSHIGKSGKRTYGLGMFWSGTRQKALKGIEIGCLAFIDVAACTALHGEAVQTPPPGTLKAVGKTLVNHYVEVVMKRIDEILSITRYLAVDGYFMKKEFVNPLLARGLQIMDIQPPYNNRWKDFHDSLADGIAKKYKTEIEKVLDISQSAFYHKIKQPHRFLSIA